MKSFCIASLVCNNRSTFFKVLSSFVEGTDITLFPEKIDWVVFVQGCTDDFVNKIKESCVAIDNLQVKVVSNAENLGLSKGMNRLHNLVKEYEYTLFLEDDWVLFPTEYNPSWLKACYDFLIEQSSVSTLALRRYKDEHEKYQYGWTRSIPYTNFTRTNNFNYESKMKGSTILTKGGLTFQHIPDFLFTMNPHIRKNSDYVKCGALPLIDIYDAVINPQITNVWKTSAHDGQSYWGVCEALSMEKTIDLKTFMVNDGLFVHYEHWF